MNTLAELREELKSKKMTVKWKVRCELGPEWIGSKREVCFFLNNQTLGDDLIHEMLIDLLIKKINIPLTSEDYMIKGEGELSILNSNLVIDYRIEYNIPYHLEYKYKKGQAILISDIGI